MSKQRYSYTGGEPPPLDIPKADTSVTVSSKRRAMLRSAWIVPGPEEMLSKTSDAKECFVYRKNSRKLQNFAMHYAFMIISTNGISGEIYQENRREL